jgi:hypothetical protein
VTRLQAARPDSQLLRRPDGTAIVVVPGVQLPPGWDRQHTCVRWVLSPAYPAAQPDCFYADHDLRISGGAMPTNTGMQQLDAQPLLWFSWHLQVAWRPGRDDLLTYLRFVESRFADVR